MATSKPPVWLEAALNGAAGRSVQPRKGFHLRIGLEDAPFGTDRSNLDLTKAAAAIVEANGRRLATPAEIRAAR